MINPNRLIPKFSYSGLTVVLSNRSRFDKPEPRDPIGLLKGNGGYFFDKECLAPETNRFCCDIQLVEHFQGLLPNTKCVLVLGDKALKLMTGTDKSLTDLRGSPIVQKGIPFVASYQPQEACDIVDHEKKFNPEAENYEDETKEDYNSDKSKGRTARSNWSFWLKQDTKKALRIVEYGIPKPKYNPVYEIYPTSQEVVDLLTNTKGQDLFFDIETDFHSADMRCFAFCFSGNPNKVYTVPCLTTRYEPAYGDLPHILRSLAVAFRDNQVVAHYGCGFDFVVLAYKYNIGIGRRVYDTLVAQQRIYPEVERSLGHCVSLWTYEPFHKDEGNHTFMTEQQAKQLFYYCGKDVFTMMLVKEAQLEFARKIPGMVESIQQANDSIRPFLTCLLTGIRYDEDLRARMVASNDRLMAQYVRCIQILTGPKVDPLISNQKCVKYFHTQLGYSPVAYTKAKSPSLAKDALMKLRLNHDNPVIDWLLAFRNLQGQTTKALVFNPWIKPLEQEQKELPL